MICLTVSYFWHRHIVLAINTSRVFWYTYIHLIHIIDGRISLILYKQNIDSMYHLRKGFYSLLLGCLYFLIHSSLLWVLCYFVYPSFFPWIGGSLFSFGLGHFIFGGGYIFVFFFLILSVILNWRSTRRKKTFEPHANYSLIYLFSNGIVMLGMLNHVDFILLSVCILIPITVISYVVERKFVQARYTEK